MTENRVPQSTFELVLGGGSLLVQVGRELNTETERRLAPLGLTAQQAALLLHAARGGSTPSLLKSQLGTDTAGMTRLLDRLEAKGLLRRERHPEDRRSIVIELTDEGQALVPRLPPVFGKISHQVFAGFSPDEVAQVTDMLRRIMKNLTDGPDA
ncbi:MarR family winged helix-turn-helix transcriptional regulator [Nonomuraea turcica]|uniref:MarR family winged helix-turn-helix transcriptional regulator n=1 Tax=Nonomuraea sp. G32 TaxID=3067274 RepID=UPI00273A99AD|nr:MarR family transcriptional regulator [Nonomuraea sp. G32]MDP4511605.1 MarR family transcriptional regulator [Nonomuraea sp. G32]